jgi:hypothetical protein
VKLHAFVKFCLLPRLLRSASDAVFCHLFTLKLHELDVPNWPAGFFWDEVRFWGCMRVTLMLPIYITPASVTCSPSSCTNWMCPTGLQASFGTNAYPYTICEGGWGQHQSVSDTRPDFDLRLLQSIFYNINNIS